MRCQLLLLTLAAMPGGRFAIKPHPSPFRMANEATAIVEGTAAANGTVTVTKTWFAAAGESIGATIDVPSLPRASKVPFDFGPPGPAIEPDAVLLFLERNEDGAWEPLLYFDGDNARGIVWFVKERAYDYAQLINPGPYELRAMVRDEGEQKVPASPDDARKQVVAGLAARAEWAATLAIGDPDRRARAIVDWIGAQCPDGAHWYERVWGDLTPALRAVGTKALPHLARVVATHAEADAVAVACRAIAALEDQAKDAVPSLVARLRDLRGAAAVEMVRALAAIGDPRATAVLLDQLDDPKGWFVKEVTIALHRSGATSFVDRIVSRLPATAAEAESVRWLADMLDAVHEVDAALAERIVRERYLGCAELLTDQYWLRRMEH